MVGRAFRWDKPAIIGSHRYNYVGSVLPANREQGLKALSTLLEAICSRWPDVCSLTSSEVGEMVVHGLQTVDEVTPARMLKSHSRTSSQVE